MHRTPPPFIPLVAGLAATLWLIGWTDAPAQRPTRVINDSVALTGALSAYMAADLDTLRVPGAVVALVRGGSYAWVRGFGAAEPDAPSKPMAPSTIVRAGSLSKIVTAVAVLQLVERGRLRLDDDAARLLGWPELPGAHGRRVTVEHLLTHTAGIDVRLNGTAATTEAGVTPLQDYVRRQTPPLVRDPGDTLVYSNHGFTLLGAIVERATGLSFDVYVRREIFEPLGMSHSGFTFPPEVERVAARGVEPAGAGRRAAPPTHPNIVPAASLNTTAADMAQFVRFHLGIMGDSGRRVLADSTRLLMQRTHFRQEPRMPGMAYGFFESNWNGHRLLLHSGGIHGFMSALYVWPDDTLALFVADNGYRGDLVTDVFFKLLKFALPPAGAAAAPPRSLGLDVAEFVGDYRSTRRSLRNLEAAGELRNPPLEAEQIGRDTLVVFGDRFVQTAPRFFRAVAGSETMAFTADARGRIAGIVTTYPFQGTEVFTRAPWYRLPSTEGLYLTAMVLLSIYLVARPEPPADIRLLKTSARHPGLRPSVRRAVQAMFFGNVALAVLLALGGRSAGAAGMLYGVPLWFDVAGILAFILMVLWLPMPIVIAREVRQRRVSLRDSRMLAAGVLVQVGFFGYLHVWNLIGIHH